MTWKIPNSDICVHTHVVHTLLLAIFITALPFGLQMDHCCVHTELQDASYLIAGCEKELFVTAVPPRSIATFHCLGLSFNNVLRFLFCLPSSQSDTSCRKRKGEQPLKISSSKENYLKEQELLIIWGETGDVSILVSKGNNKPQPHLIMPSMLIYYYSRSNFILWIFYILFSLSLKNI